MAGVRWAKPYDSIQRKGSTKFGRGQIGTKKQHQRRTSEASALALLFSSNLSPQESCWSLPFNGVLSLLLDVLLWLHQHLIFSLLRIVIYWIVDFKRSECVQFEEFKKNNWIKQAKDALNHSPSISFIALIKSAGSLKLIKPKPLLLPVRLSRITFAFKNDEYLLNVRVSISSFTSFPKSPQKMRKSSSCQSASEWSSHTWPPAVRTVCEKSKQTNKY